MTVTQENNKQLFERIIALNEYAWPTADWNNEEPHFNMSEFVDDTGRHIGDVQKQRDVMRDFLTKYNMASV